MGECRPYHLEGLDRFLVVLLRSEVCAQFQCCSSALVWDDFWASRGKGPPPRGKRPARQEPASPRRPSGPALGPLSSQGLRPLVRPLARRLHLPVAICVCAGGGGARREHGQRKSPSRVRASPPPAGGVPSLTQIARMAAAGEPCPVCGGRLTLPLRDPGSWMTGGAATMGGTVMFGGESPGLSGGGSVVKARRAAWGAERGDQNAWSGGRVCYATSPKRRLLSVPHLGAARLCPTSRHISPKAPQVPPKSGRFRGNVGPNGRILAQFWPDNFRPSSAKLRRTPLNLVWRFGPIWASFGPESLVSDRVCARRFLSRYTGASSLV